MVNEPSHYNTFGDLQVWGTSQLSLVSLFVAQDLLYYCQRFFLFSFLLLPKFTVAGLATHDKHAFYGYLNLFTASQGQSSLGPCLWWLQLSCPLLQPLSSLALCPRAEAEGRRTVQQASTFVTAKTLSSVGSHFLFPALILCPFKPELLLLLICIDCSLSNHPTLNEISSCF